MYGLNGATCAGNSASVTTGLASRPITGRKSLDCSSASTPTTSTVAQGWDWPFANGSSIVIMAGSGWNPPPDRDQSSGSPSPTGKQRGDILHVLIVEDNTADLYLIKHT